MENSDRNIPRHIYHSPLKSQIKITAGRTAHTESRMRSRDRRSRLASSAPRHPDFFSTSTTRLSASPHPAATQPWLSRCFKPFYDSPFWFIPTQPRLSRRPRVFPTLLLSRKFRKHSSLLFSILNSFIFNFLIKKKSFYLIEIFSKKKISLQKQFIDYREFFDIIQESTSYYVHQIDRKQTISYLKKLSYLNKTIS